MGLNINDIKSPGVYVDEVSLLAPSVAAVGTSIPAFVGYTQIGAPATDDDIKAVKIASLREYTDLYGTTLKPAVVKVKVLDTLNRTGGDVIKRVITATPEEGGSTKHNLYYALQHYFANGGGACYIVSVGAIAVAGPASAKIQKGIEACVREDEPTMLVAPEAVHSGATHVADIYVTALNQSANLMDRVVIMDVEQKADNNTVAAIEADFSTFRPLVTNHLSYGAAYYPYLDTTISYLEADDANVAIEHKTVVAGAAAETAGAFDASNLGAIKTTNGVLYSAIKTKSSRMAVQLPPSAAIAGIYAQTDRERGVWKAPANVGVSAIVGPALKFDNAIQDNMNIHESGKSINAIRVITGRGTVVWGARTLDGNSNEWRYVPVRRFFNFVEESVKKSTYRFVFEPNDANTWVKVRAMIENFLTLQWRAGALQGAKPEQAFFVRVGLGQTMSAQDILEGRMIVEIGMAVVRPAEFIILRFEHKLAEA